MTDYTPLTPPGINGSVYVKARDTLPSGVGPGLGCVSNGTNVACSYQQSPNALIYYDANGNVLWTSGNLLDSNAYGSAPLIQADGSVVIGDDHNLYKFNGNGTVAWSTPSPGGGPVSLVTTPNGAIVSVTHQARAGRCTQDNCQLAATINNPGSGYTTASLLFGGGYCPGAAATATITGGQITGITITNQPTTCIIPPDMVIVGDGVNAVASAQLRTPTPMIAYNGTTGAIVNSVYLYSNGANSAYYGTVNTPCVNNGSYPNRIYVSTNLITSQSQGALWALDIDPTNLTNPISPAWSINFAGPSGASPLCVGNNVYFDGSGYQPGDNSGTTIFGVQDTGTSGTMLFHVSLGPGTGPVTCNFALDPRAEGGFWHQIQYDPNIYHRDATTGNLIESINMSNLLMANGAPPGNYWMRGVFTTYGTPDHPYMVMSESDSSYIASYLAMVDITNSVLIWALPFYPANSMFSTDTPEGAAALVMDSTGQPVLAIAGANTGAYFVANGPATLAVSTNFLSFGNTAVSASSAAQPITLTDNGSAVIQISSINTSGDFTQTNSCSMPLAPGTSCVIQATFSPSATETRSGTVTITDSAATSPQTVILSGVGVTGTAAIGFSTTLLTFMGQLAGTISPPQSVNLSNTGTGVLSISGITATGDTVQSNNCPPSLAPGGSCAINVMFAAAALGPRTGGVTVTGNAPNSPQTVLLTGTGLPALGAAVSLSSTSLVFPAQRIGSMGTTQTVVLENAGIATLNINGITTSGEAVQSNDCGPNLAPGLSCSITVNFAPAGTGLRTGAIVISDNAPDSPEAINVIGIGSGNPVPLLVPLFAPASQFPGNAGFTMTVTGGGFIPGAAVDWNGTPLVTSYISSAELAATVPASASAAANTAWINVRNPGPGGGLSSPAWLPIGNPSSNVSLGRTDLAVAVGPQALAVADFNGDGKADLAVVNAGANSVSIFLGNGDGTFAPRTDYPAGSQPVALAVGDFNNDGRPDLAVVNQAGNTLSTFLGNGNGTFAPMQSFATGTSPDAVVAVDWNGDGNLDLAVANRADNTVSILAGNGNGSFNAHVDYPAGPSPSALTAADFNCDGKIDLAVANDYAGGTVSVLLGNGDGSLQAPVAYPTGDSEAIAAADFNGDGKLDLAAVNQAAQSLSVLLGNGDGTFQKASATPLAPWPAGIAIAPLNNDGTLRVVTVAALTSSVSILQSNNDGTFRGPSNFGTASGPLAIAVADLNGDGSLDLVTASPGANTISILLQTPQATFSSTNVNFGSVAVGASGTQTVTLTNTGSALLQISGISANAAFSQVNNCPASLIPGSACNITVTFAPLTAGTQSGLLTVSGNISSGSGAINLTGSGTAVVTVNLSQTTVTGGNTLASNTADLSSPAPAGGAGILLASSNPNIAAVPASVAVAQGSTVSSAFSITTANVSSATQVSISATYAGVTSGTALTITPVAIASVSLSPTTTVGGKATSSNTVNLTGPAPAVGAAVILTSSSPAAATPPPTVTVAPGTTSSTFSITTAAVSSRTQTTISATYGGANTTSVLTVNPPTPSAVRLSQANVTGGGAVTGNRITLTGPAPAGGVTIALSSSNPAAASVPASVIVSAGKTASQQFTINTSAVTAPVSVTISATYLRTTKSATLTLSP